MMPGDKYSFLEHVLFPPTGFNERRLHGCLNGKNVLITGASYGIGECLALRLANTGAQLVLVARTEEKLAGVKKEVERLGGKALVFSADLSKQEEVDRLLTTLEQLPGGVDIVVNNAGKSIHRSIRDSLDRYHDFTRSMAINYFGPVRLMLALIPILEKNSGHIINVSAINVLLAPAPHWAAYQSSKSAFDNWFRCAAPELSAMGVSTTSIYLPLVRTRMIEPTPMYQKMPAMSADHAARIICKAIVTQKSRVAPWWLIFGQLASVILRRPWESISAYFLKRKHPYAP